MSWRALRVPVMAVGMVALLTGGWVMSGRLLAQLPPLTVAGVRTLFTLPVVIGLVLVKARYRKASVVALRRPVALAKLALLGFFLYSVCTVFAITMIGASASGILVGLMPCLTLVIGVAAFRERSTPTKWVGTVLAVAASVVYGLRHGVPVGLAQATGWTIALGVGLALAGTFFYSLYGFAYRAEMGDLPSLASLPGIAGVATLMLVPTALLIGEDLWSLSLAQLGALFLLGAVFTAPVYVLSHELVLVRGPLFTASAAVCLPFLVRSTEWVLGVAPVFTVFEVTLFALAAAGVLLVVRSGDPTRRPDEGRALKGEKSSTDRGSD
ncbi:DMT family transporter [Saccharothrix sp. Mg75]|uniref:DMT family transporter n=1 Tax=Saccharothrix sp. Mg75 TaxID=3445357 RepID=UPI003EED8F0C